MFEKMDEQLLDAMCSRLKPVLYTENSFVVREGDPVDEMLFIMRGKIYTMTTNGGRTGFFNSVYLMAGDFCGEELLTWALDPNSSSSLPISTRTVRAVTDVEAFCLMPDDLKFVTSQFRRLHSKQLQHAFRQVLEINKLKFSIKMDYNSIKLVASDSTRSSGGRGVRALYKQHGVDIAGGRSRRHCKRRKID